VKSDDGERHRPLRRVARAGLTIALLALVALIGMADYWTGTEIAFSIFFLIPIALAAWFLGSGTSAWLAVASSVAWFLADRYGGFPYSNPAIPCWNAVMGLGFFLIIGLTLSARRRSVQRILELMEARSQFTSMVSHELRTPLTCIKEGIAIVLDDDSAALTGAQRGHLLTAKRNVDRLARLVSEVLTFQKLDARQVELALVPADLGLLVQRSLSDFALVARQRGLELSAEQSPALPLVVCDADRIRLALDNLIGNALKFTASGRIHVRAEHVPAGVRVSVQDSGPGIRHEDQARLFQAFTQLAEHAHLRAEGTGLGLAIVRRIVELHGGLVGVESSRGRGSTFHFTLPLVPPAAQRPRHRTVRASSRPEAGDAVHGEVSSLRIRAPARE